ncbi:NADH-quinone oxidoreductase subunit A [Thiotrichales bacterium 19X7-9]|nr:NADH-quinone oxidoreductase subunit A [Thiotrichales bacterium 19X7-9]
MLYENYLPVLVFLILSSLVGIGAAVAGKMVSKFVGADRPSEEKNSPFECGFPEFEDARMKFDVRYYLVAILFLVFDLEIAFLFPWSAVLSKLSLIAFLSMMVFLFVLLIGFIYEWKKGALEWE